MRPVTVDVAATGTPAVVVPLDLYLQGPITVSIGNVDGTVDIDIEYTLDDPYAPGFDQATANWQPTPFANEAAATAGALTDANGDPIRPRAVRATNGGAGTAQFTIIQAGLIT